jgi:hypothetical protein
VLKFRDWLSSLFKVETLVLAGKHNSRVQVCDILSPDDGKAAANVKGGGSADRNDTDGVNAGRPSPENATGKMTLQMNAVSRLVADPAVRPNVADVAFLRCNITSTNMRSSGM